MEILSNMLKPLFILLITLIGGILSIWGLGSRRYVILAFGAACLLSALISTMYESAQFNIVVSALSTLTLALVAVFAFWENRQLRQQSLKKEERDRKERLLNEIIGWAEAVANSAIGRQAKDPHELWKTKLEYKKHKTKGKLIGEMVSSSFNKELSGSFKDINKRLDKAIEFTKQIEDGKSNVESLKDYETEIAGSVEKMFKKAAKIKNGKIN